MNFRARGLLRYAAPLATFCLLSACGSGSNTAPALSQVDAVGNIPVADTTTRVNVNTANPTLNELQTFQVSDGDLLTLVWSDEFDGARLDPEVWFFATGDGAEAGLPSGWGNNESQWYLPDNARLEDGKLKIEARRESVGDFGFTSARMNTQNRIAVKYGRIEARIKLPGGQGVWPAFWMLPQDNIYGTFAASGEIDIVEAVNLGGNPGPGGAGGANDIFGTIHFGGVFPANQSASTQITAPETVTEDFHNYAVEWDEFEIRWYFDNQLYAMQNSWNSAGGPYPAPFDQPFYILLNLAIGGNFPGSPDSSTPALSTLEVDWVRVFSGEEGGDSGSGGGGGGTVPGVVATFDETPERARTDFGGAFTELDANPPAGGGTGNALKMTRSGDNFAGTFVEIPAIPSDAGNQTMSARVFSPTAGIRVVAKLDFAENMGTGDVEANEAVVMGWQTLTWTFTNLDAANSYTRFVILPNLGTVDTDVVYYFDDITLVDPGGGNGGSAATTVASFDETPALARTDFGGAFTELDANPPAGGGTGNALKMTRNGENFAGTFVEIPAIPSDAGNQTMSARVFSPTAGIRVVTKLDFAENMGTGDVEANEAVVMGWQTLTWTFTNLDAANSYTRFVILPNLGVVDTDEVYYFDDVTLLGAGGGDGGGEVALSLATFDENPPPAVTEFGGAGFAADQPGPAGGNGSGNALKITRDGGDVFAGAFVSVSGVPSDAGTQTISAEVFSPAAGVPMVTKLEFAESQGTGDVQANETVVMGWQTLTWTYTNLMSGNDYNRFVILPNLGTVDTAQDYYFDNIALLAASSGGGGGTDGGSGNGGAGSVGLAENSDFETADFTGWETFDNGGTVIISSPGSTGSSAAMLNAPPGRNPTLKQTGIGAGVLGPNEQVTVQFDWMGSAASGGVVDIRMFSELGGDGGVTKTDVLQGGDAFPANWTTFGPTTITTAGTATDIAGGLTIQINAICGGDAGCVSELFIDNVVIERVEP